MISRHSRRNVRPVEPLNQFPITAAKGVDGTKNADSLDTVQDLQNFDITVSGDAELRKPMVLQKDYGEVLYTKVLYDNTSRLIVSQYGTVTIVNGSGTVQPIRFVWFDYHTLQEYSSENVPNAAFIAWANAQFANTNTATVVTNVEVDLNASYLKVDGEAVIYDPKLYDDSTVQLRFRTLQIYWSDEDQIWTIKINSPEVNVLSASDTISLDANMALDNPYAVRDEYGVSASSVKGALPYVQTHVSDTGNVVVEPTGNVSSPTVLDETVANTGADSSYPSSPEISIWNVEPLSATEASVLGEGADKVWNAIVTVTLNTTAQDKAVHKRILDGGFMNANGYLPTIVSALPIWAVGRNGTSVPVADLYKVKLQLSGLQNVLYSGEYLHKLQYLATVTREFYGRYEYVDADSLAPWNYYDPDPSPQLVNVTGFYTDSNLTHLPPSFGVCAYWLQRALQSTRTSSGGWPTTTTKSMYGRMNRFINFQQYSSDPAYAHVGSESPQNVTLFYAGYTGARGDFRFYALGFPTRWSDSQTQIYGSYGGSSTDSTARIALNLRLNGNVNAVTLGDSNWSQGIRVTRPPAVGSTVYISEDYF